jgi:hypothetical protein
LGFILSTTISPWVEEAVSPWIGEKRREKRRKKRIWIVIDLNEVALLSLF